MASNKINDRQQNVENNSENPYFIEFRHPEFVQEQGQMK